jgi:hypothetical protein
LTERPKPLWFPFAVPSCFLRFALILMLVLVGCSALYSDQWVLKSYDKQKGYVFVKDGIEYHTSCFAYGVPTLGLGPDSPPDLSPTAFPPSPAFGGQEDCADILVYLHKPVPNFKMYGGVLLFIGEKNFRLEFEIEQAK